MTPARRGAARLLLPLVLGALAGCGSGDAGSEPPVDELFFPTGVVADPAGDVVYVTNGNADLRFSGGTVSAFRLGGCGAGAIDACALDAFAAFRDPTATRPAGCEPDALDPTVPDCDERAFHVPGATVKVGNFAGELRLQPIPSAAAGGPTARLFLPVRGDPSVTWIEATHTAGGDVALSCGAAKPDAQCAGTHRLERFCASGAPEAACPDDLLQGVPSEPFGIFLDAALGLVYVTHLQRGEVSLIDARDPLGSDPFVSDVRGGLLDPDDFGRAGAFALAPRVPGVEGELVYVTSRTTSQITSFVVVGNRLLSGPAFTLAALEDGADNRGIAFSSDGARAFVLNRRPASLLTIDTTLDPDGQPANRVLDVVEVCAEPSVLGALDVAPGGDGGLRLYVVCFATGEVWAIDADTGLVLDAVDVGRGPNAVTFVDRPGARRMVVSNFIDNTLAVIDVEPGSPTEHHVLGRIGTPQPLELR